MITIWGRRGDGPWLRRRVSMVQAHRAWGRWFMQVILATRSDPLVVDDMVVWSEG